MCAAATYTVVVSERPSDMIGRGAVAVRARLGTYRPAYSHAPWAAYFRAVARARFEAVGYRIVVNMGDQPSDLAGGHAEKAVLLPNPFYRIP